MDVKTFKTQDTRRKTQDTRHKTQDTRRKTQDARRKTQVAGYGERAFTLIELLLVVVIIGALVAMVTPRLVGRGEQARIGAAKADIQANIATALKLYELDNGTFPDSLEGLLSSTGSAVNWNGPYIEKKPVDPWGREYKYKSPGDHRQDYDLYSLGKDGVEGNDDITNWE
ncbi:MAG: type II secretion system major pseudopilin GspG [Candidatus Omnitrophota bacterium]